MTVEPKPPSPISTRILAVLRPALTILALTTAVAGAAYPLAMLGAASTTLPH